MLGTLKRGERKSKQEDMTCQKCRVVALGSKLQEMRDSHLMKLLSVMLHFKHVKILFDMGDSEIESQDLCLLCIITEATGTVEVLVAAEVPVIFR
ncbi:hypothetical protein H5410_063085 [Solanum commersonii]|uniref:Uncharacterized protein n=1 Tax=Solanum commersonii TaxID=4109 RepID=A0A9J5WDC0_SOLCO|nr:hypothetical protein H5410_063085 [Solanum commersonii]